MEVKSVKSGKIYSAAVWRDISECTSAEALYLYTDSYYSQNAAVTRNQSRKGTIYYIGTGVDAEVMNGLAEDLVMANNIEFIKSPAGVEVYKRGGKYFIMNHTGKSISFGNLQLCPYDYRITEKIN